MGEQGVSTVPQADEKQKLVESLREGRNRYLYAFQGVLDSSSTWRKAPGKWSILECAEHVAVSEEQMFRAWEKLAAPGKSDPAKDRAVQNTAKDREHKMTCPERALPKGRCQSLSEALERFRTARERTLQLAESAPLEELRGKVVPHPLMETIDGYQLLLLMAAHAERHALQIKEITSDPEFPSAQHP